MTETEKIQEGMTAHGRHVQGESPPPTPPPVTDNGTFVESLRDHEIFTFVKHVIKNYCPWLGSTEELKKSFRIAVSSLKERPATSILYGLILIFGFIPFVGFVLLICGSFAVLFTWFIFCQFIVVVLSALLCTGVFWAMAIGFAVLAFLLGGAIHTIMFWSVLAKHAGRLARKFSIFILQLVGIPENDLPGPQD
ncbi:hypothetical protein PoB_006584200 [Plakobranchus ocellatus]|uniref:Promethin n=1 Tax=Plakobranchus ocellatus TaxID=259542 RepID=A0AAV4D5B6_9GAST|nr:hypothetical protein PoB_006584200 [Plakobranchus ocellatus]